MTKQAENNYKIYKNKLVSIIRISKKDYYHTLLNKYKSNTKKTWEVLNSIIKTNRGKVDYPNYFVNDESGIINKVNDIVNTFNEYFVNVGFKLAQEIVEQRNEERPDEVDIPSNIHSIFIRGTHEMEILDIVNNCKNKKSTDCNDIDMSLLKNIIEYIVKPFTYICNQSFLTGIFPNNMKIAKIIPIFKSGDRHLFSNYRPISLLSQFSKILEKLFVCRLDNFIDKHKLLSEHQYGFRANRSTSIAVMEMVEEISTSMDNNEYTLGVFLDLKKAFDTIDHGLLMRKLERYGIRGKAYFWLKSYLDDRYQFVQINDVRSDLMKVTCGVPQGSVLGPIMFVLYINDICEVSKILKMVLFADDTNLYCSGKNLEQLLNTVEIELMILKKWFDDNRLSLNLSKTKFIIFGNRKSINKVKIRINNEEIDRVYENKFLGVIIDHKLSWKPHINHVKRKMSQSIAILHKTKHILNENSLYILYCALIVPYMIYCVEVWGHAYKTNINPIYMLQKRAIRIIKHVDYHEPTNQLFSNLNALKFFDLVNFYTVQTMYKVYSNLLPNCIQRLFEIRESQYGIRGMHMFKKIRVRTNTKNRCISVKGVNLWNNLHTELKLCNSLCKFKKMFKNKVVNDYLI